MMFMYHEPIDISFNLSEFNNRANLDLYLGNSMLSNARIKYVKQTGEDNACQDNACVSIVNNMHM